MATLEALCGRSWSEEQLLVRTNLVGIATQRTGPLALNGASSTFCLMLPSRVWVQQVELEKDTAVVLTAQIADFICGLLISWIVVDELQLLELVVHPDARRRGIGRTLMQALIEAG